LTLNIAARTLFGANVSSETDEVRDALRVAMELFPRFLSPLSELLDRLPIPSTRRFEAARARLDAVVYRLIARRRSSGGGNDLLAMLLLAREGEANGTPMSDRQVRDEAMTIILAGHETTANALAWTLFLLSQNPGAAAKVVAEVEATLGEGPARAEDAQRLAYTRLVLTEAMRLYPPAWILGRRAIADVEVGGYAVRSSEVVLMSQYVVHRDPRFYDEPDAFQPERWEGSTMLQLPKFAYFPFGGGNRLCIGEQFAWMEGVLVLATLVRRWRLDFVAGSPVDIMPLVTLRPRYPLPMVVRARDTAPVLASHFR